MARCCGDSCVCKLVGGEDVNGHTPMSILGTGTLSDPFSIAFTGVDVDDTASVNMSVAWDADRGYVISATAVTGGTLAALSDVAVGSQTNGQVLSWHSATSKWIPAAPTTAPGGALTTDNSLTGDGSVGLPLEVQHQSGRFTGTFSSGIGMTDAGIQQLVRTFATAAARTAADPSPELNALSVLDTDPGVINYWDGTAWQTLNTGSGATGLGFVVIGDAQVPMSGAYTGGPVTMLVKGFNTTLESDKTFIMFTAADLAPYAGILGAWADMDSLNPSGVGSGTPEIYYFTGPISINGLSYQHNSNVNPPNVSGTAYALVY